MRRQLFSFCFLTTLAHADFAEDVALAKDGVVLGREGHAQILVAPRHFGAVLAATGDDGESIGFIRREALAKGAPGVGGADRLWFGPDGSQFTVFFAPGAALEEKNWRVHPAVEMPMEVVEQDANSVKMQAEVQLENHLGTTFRVRIDRNVKWVHFAEISWDDPPWSSLVAYVVANKMTNLGPKMSAENGLLSLWSLATFQGGEDVEVLMAVDDPASVRRYFEPFADGQLEVKGGIARFRATGNWRTKIGLAAEHCNGKMVSFDRKRGLLTYIKYRLTEGERWPHSGRGPQEEPYAGDAVNIYNHGRIDRKPLAEPAFYEMESASPMLELDTGESQWHMHVVHHFRIDPEELETFAVGLLKGTVGF